MKQDTSFQHKNGWGLVLKKTVTRPTSAVTAPLFSLRKGGMRWVTHDGRLTTVFIETPCPYAEAQGNLSSGESLRGLVTCHMLGVTDLSRVLCRMQG